MKEQLPAQHPARKLSIAADDIRKKLSAAQLDDLLVMIGAENFIRRGLVFHTYQMLLLFRYHKTEYSEDEVLVVVAKFGAPSLEEEVSGRLEHKVTITSKRMTKALATLPPIAKFNYGCSCKAKKKFCIHVAIVLLLDFSDDQMI